MPATRPPDRLVVPAPAKINLFLHVGAKRADGFHDIESLVVFAAVGDELVVERDASLSLSIVGRFGDGLSDGTDNLVMKAARLLAARTGATEGARMTLRKELPVASGIGGGSADAAAAMRGLSALWNLDLPEEKLLAVAGELGSDVPMCLGSRHAWIAGRGERIAPAPPLPEFHLLLVNPLVPISTAEVFAGFDRSNPPLRESVGGNKFADLDSFMEFLKSAANDLEAPAREIAPVVGEVVGEIARQKRALLARMSGSGATCFGIFATDAATQIAAASFASKHPDWWVAATALVSERGHIARTRS